MLQSVMTVSATTRGRTNETRRKIRLNAAARLFGIQSTYLSRVARNGVLERAGVSVIRHPEYPEIVEFYEDELFTWWKSRHPEWINPQETN